MACDNQVGVKNILITFTDCATGQVFSKISHELSSEDLPTIRACGYTNEALPGGYTKRNLSNAQIELKVIRDLRVPLPYYQGCAGIDIQVEYLNGLVYTGFNGTTTGDESSDTHEVTMTVAYKLLDELLPAGTLQAAA
jgi:hypothetical protein